MGICQSEQSQRNYKKGNINTQDLQKKLFVLTAFFMPVYSNTRVYLYKKFEAHMATFSNVELYTIQCAFDNQQFSVTNKANKNHIQVKSNCKIWIKQNLLNILMKKIPAQAKYIAWIDADVVFTNKNWVNQTINKLKVCDIVQLFFSADFINVNGLPEFNTKSLMYYASTNYPRLQQFNKSEQTYPHPGYAWAMTVEYKNKIQKLFQYNIIGSGDKLMAYAILNMWQYGLQKQYKLNKGFINSCLNWSKNCIPKNGYGYISGNILHDYHGERSARDYVSRWQLFQIFEFNPQQDIAYNQYGVIILKNKQLEAQISQYFKKRKDQNPNIEKYIKQNKNVKKNGGISGSSSTKVTYTKNYPIYINQNQYDKISNYPTFNQPDRNSNHHHNHHNHHHNSHHHNHHDNHHNNNHHDNNDWNHGGGGHHNNDHVNNWDFGGNSGGDHHGGHHGGGGNGWY